MKTAKGKVLLYYTKMKSLTEGQNNHKFHFKGIHYIHNFFLKVVINMSNTPEIAF